MLIKHKFRKLLISFMLIFFIIGLTSCGKDLDSALGFVKKQPDEFEVRINHSISIPKGLSKRPILPPVIISEEEQTIAKASELDIFTSKERAVDEDSSFLKLLSINDDVSMEKRRIEADLYGLLILSDKIITNIENKIFKLDPAIKFVQK